MDIIMLHDLRPADCSALLDAGSAAHQGDYIPSRPDGRIGGGLVELQRGAGGVRPMCWEHISDAFRTHFAQIRTPNGDTAAQVGGWCTDYYFAV